MSELKAFPDSDSRNNPIESDCEIAAQLPKNHIGIVVDRFWMQIPSDHFAYKVNPLSMPAPHQHFLSLGQEVIRVCETKGCSFDIKLSGDEDILAWTRLLGAWVIFCRSRFNVDGKLPSRSAVAHKVDLDPSSLTNFLNARRPITLKALQSLSHLMGVHPLDIRPEIGASGLYSKERKAAKSMASIRNNLDCILRDLRKVVDSPDGNHLLDAINKVKALKRKVAA
jgi:hypothetical protein